MKNPHFDILKHELMNVPSEWFFDPHGIHGIGHTQRVYHHAKRLSEALYLTEDAKEPLLLAALWHDIGRKDDSVDPNHGQLSVMKVKALDLHRMYSQEMLELTFLAIEYHSKDDSIGELACLSASNPHLARTILRALKDADALDRVRIGCLNPAYLRFPWTHTQIDYAKSFFESFHAMRSI